MYKYIKAMASRAEDKMKPQDYVVLKFCLGGFFVAIIGFAIAVLVSHKAGYVITSIGVMVGVVSVAYGNVLLIGRSIESHKQDKVREEEFKNRKQPWE